LRFLKQGARETAPDFLWQGPFPGEVWGEAWGEVSLSLSKTSKNFQFISSGSIWRKSLA